MLSKSKTKTSKHVVFVNVISFATLSYVAVIDNPSVAKLAVRLTTNAAIGITRPAGDNVIIVGFVRLNL